MYTMSEFRKNLRKAFELASAGEIVEITRYGETFELLRKEFGKPGKLTEFKTTPREEITPYDWGA